MHKQVLALPHTFCGKSQELSLSPGKGSIYKFCEDLFCDACEKQH